MAEFAGYYTEAQLDANGKLRKSTAYSVFLPGTNTFAEIYTDRTKSGGSSTGEFLTTSNVGNASFYADPGLYEIEFDSTRTLITVGMDEGEPEAIYVGLISSVNESIGTRASVEYVDEQISLVNSINTDQFAKRNEDNNFGGFKVSNVRTTTSTITGTTYTITNSDTGNILRFTSNSAITVTLPNSTPADTLITVLQRGTGQITFTAASGATRSHRQNHTKTAGQNAFVSLYVDANSGGSSAAWILGGDTAA